jgi:molecular chaperone GrpE
MSSEQLKDQDPDTNAAAADAVDDLRRERDDLRDRLLRSVAEFDNYRKRTDRERRELSDAVAADLIRDLLPVVDDLERALAVPPAPGESGLRAGIELIHKQILDVLRRRGVEPLQTVGHDFDPSWHEALASEPAGGRRDGEITAELRRGFRIGPRLLRAAQVKVAKA